MAPNNTQPDTTPGTTPSAQQLLQVLQEVIEAVNCSLILEDIFEALGDVLRQHVPYREATIVILDESQNGIKIMVRVFEDGGLEISGENNAFAGYDAVINQLLQSPEAALYDVTNLPQSVVFAPQTASALVTPLINKGVVIGLIAMGAASPGVLTESHLQLLGAVSSQVAVAVENARLYWQTQAQASREFLINQLTKAIRQSLDIEVILSTAVHELGKVTGVSRCYIQYTPDADAVEGTQIFGYVLPGVPAILADELMGAGIERQVYTLRRKTLDETLKQLDSAAKVPQVVQEAFNPFIINDVRDCPGFLQTGTFFTTHGILSMAVFPILIRERLVGTITLHQCDAYRVWVMEDIELLRAIAEHLGVALHQAQLFLELERQKRALENTLNELQQTQVQLVQSEKMAMLGQFVAGIAHEVNTPLGAMTSNDDTIRSCIRKIKEASETGAELNPKWTSTMENLLAVNKVASDRITEIVRNLRNFARIDESELKAVDLEENLDSTILLLKHTLKERNVRLVKDIPKDLPPIECFPGLLNQVFMNLMVNAAHAVEGRPDPTLTITARHDMIHRVMRVAITDNGKGIPDEHKSRIFDPGFTTKGVGVGTGLGLALCFKIMEKHHGLIEVESVVGKGTTMTVVLPVRQVY